MDITLDLDQFIEKIFFFDVLQNQNKLISTVTDQDIRLADTVFNWLYHRSECGISHTVAERIVAQFEVIHINDSHPGIFILFLDLLFKIATVIYTGQCIFIQSLIILDQLIDQLFTATGIHQRIHVHVFDKLHHAVSSVYFYVSGSDLIKLILDKFKLGLLCPLIQCLQGSAVFTRMVFIPYFIALTFLFFVFTVQLASLMHLLQMFSIQQPHNGKDFLEKLHFVFCLLPCYTVCRFHKFISSLQFSLSHPIFFRSF